MKASKIEMMKKIFTWVAIIGVVNMILISVGTISGGFKLFSGGSDGAEAMFEFATNPIIALLLGLTATALIQSSSTVTTVIVGLVAGGLPMEIAVPMIFGANIGTSLTSTIVSVGHIGNKEEFRRAFAASTVHDFFNIFAVLILFPLELMTGFLQKSATYLTTLVSFDSSMSIKELNFIKPITKPITNAIQDTVTMFHADLAGIAMVGIGITLIIVSITVLGKLLKVVMCDKTKTMLSNAMGKSPVTGILTGTAITVAVQSSSTTTSLIIPFAGAGTVTTKQVYRFALGANIGTTITALLASTALSGDAQTLGLTIALVHLLFNVIGVLIIYGIPQLRNIPVVLAEAFANRCADNKFYALGYVLTVFFAIPFAVLFAMH